MFRLLLASILTLLACIQVSGGVQSQFRVVLVSGCNEYFSDISLSNYQAYLENSEGAQATLLKAGGPLNSRDEYSELPGVEELTGADVALLFLRRTTISGSALDKIKDFIGSGKGVVAVRTSSHGLQNWLEFDKEVLGGNYTGHYGGSPENSGIDAARNRYPIGQPKGPTLEARIVKGQERHPILTGIVNFRSRYSLYQTSPVAQDARVLMTGHLLEQRAEPLVWAREHKGGRVVYIGLGGLQDWENSTFRRLVTNAIFWAGARRPPEKALSIPPQRPKPKGVIPILMRSRKETKAGSDAWQEVAARGDWKIAETAIVICDMWDQHWCEGAAKRCEELAIRMNPVLRAARQKGIQIVHAPSSTLPFYEYWPQRRRMQLAPEAPTPKMKEVKEVPPLPIDDSDGGCDTDNKSYSAWTRQSPHIEIGPYDGISDDGNEVYRFFKAQGIRNMIIMGVHTNMCVLNRSFGIRQMTRRGIRCVLVRDLTDAMYDPKDPPHVSHERGVELVVEHIEKYWCPSMSSKDLMPWLNP
jgi:type 1 glutamine amidotransferase/nicotinamidase-related amidase